MNGISRQGVWEIVHRAEEIMRRIDERTGLVARLEERRAALKTIREALTPLLRHADGKCPGPPAARLTRLPRSTTERRKLHWRLKAFPKSSRPHSRSWRGKGRLTEQDVTEAMREVRLALLEADVSYKVVKDFVKRVTERARGAEVLESLTPAQMVVKIVNEELCSLMGSEK